MKVFMSWSGNRSRETAELLANWAKCVVQATQPWISTSGIDRGAVWYSAINEELNNTSVGIVCLTHENKNKPWILFESGALAKGLSDSRVCTFLIDLKPGDLEPPLSQFNHTTPDRAGLWNLARTLNTSVATPLDAKILEQVFDVNYPLFEEGFARILAAYPVDEEPEARTPDSILGELLESSRSMSQRLRNVEQRFGENVRVRKSNYMSDLLKPGFVRADEAEDVNHRNHNQLLEAEIRLSSFIESGASSEEAMKLAMELGFSPTAAASIWNSTKKPGHK
jgi:hypothetical protein